MHTLSRQIDNLSSASFRNVKRLLSGLSALVTLGFVVALEAGQALGSSIAGF